MKLAIVTDSTCDLPDEVVQRLGIAVVPLYINIGAEGYLDGKEISRQEFYRNLPDYEDHPTTATPSIESFLHVYEEVANKGYDQILSLHLSETLSATVDMARRAAVGFKDAEVHVRDSGQLSMGLGFQAEEAGKMAQAGRTLDEVNALLDDYGPRCFVAAHLDTLEFLRRSGRMNSLMSGLGSVLKIKPILKMEDGEASTERVRTVSKAQARLQALLEERQPIERFALLHSNSEAAALEFKAKVAHMLPAGESYVMDITPVLGVHLGPNAIGYATVSG